MVGKEELGEVDYNDADKEDVDSHDEERRLRGTMAEQLAWPPTRHGVDLTRPGEAAEASSSAFQQAAVADSRLPTAGWLRPTHCLYLSHFMSRWGDRMWEFAAGLLLLFVWRKSLLLTALYGLVEAASVALLGGFAGAQIDKTPRLVAVGVSILAQNTSVVAAAVALAIMSSMGSVSNALFIALAMAVIAGGGFAALAGQACSVAVERDWVVVLASDEAQSPALPENDGHLPGVPEPNLPTANARLTHLNAVMRRIDLCCLVLAPIAVGAVMSSMSARAAALLIAGWNIVSGVGEYALLVYVYKQVPALQVKSTAGGSKQHQRDFGMQNLGQYERVGADDAEAEITSTYQERKKATLTRLVEAITTHAVQALSSWRVYWKQETFLPALSLALLYLTVLSFGTLMTAYLKSTGVNELQLAAARGCAAGMGVLATFIYPIMTNKVKPLRSGLRSIWAQASAQSVVCLIPCVVAIYVQSARASAVLLIVGVIFSRVGLWSFDLSVTQLVQEVVPEHERGVVGGVQCSIQETFAMLGFLLGVGLPDTSHFWILSAACWNAEHTTLDMWPPAIDTLQIG
eukprot:jgi/Chlat1/3240/Chrsp22S03423